MNRQSNRQSWGNVDNSEDRDPKGIQSLVHAYIEDALKQADGGE